MNRAPDYIYDADTPRLLRDARALRLREDRRRLRLQVRVLHHPDAARRLSQPARPTRSCREARALAARRRQGTAAHLAGHDLLRHRPAGARRACAPAARVQHRRRASSGSGCSTSIPRRSTTRRWRRWRSATRSATTSTCRCSTRRIAVLKRMKRPGTRQQLRPAAHPHSRARPWRGAPHDVHRRLPGETEADVDRVVRIRQRPRVRPRRRVHLFARGRHVRTTQLDDDVPARSKAARRSRVMELAEAARAKAQSRTRIGERVRVGGRRAVARPRARAEGAAGHARRPISTRRCYPDRLRPVRLPSPAILSRWKSSAPGSYDLHRPTAIAVL